MIFLLVEKSLNSMNSAIIGFRYISQTDENGMRIGSNSQIYLCKKDCVNWTII